MSSEGALASMRTNELADSQHPHAQGESRRLIPDGLEVVPDGQDGKEVVQPEKEVLHSSATAPHRDVKEPLIQPDETFTPQQDGPRMRRICGLRPKSFWILLAVGLVLAVGLGIGLGVGLSSGDSPSNSDDSPSATATSAPTPSASVQSRALIGGALNASYYSDRGAWNGSGLANNLQTLGPEYEDQPDNGQNLVMYYQHHSGDIRWQRLASNARWLRGPEDREIVASDAKNSTGISAVNYNQDGADVWHVFYIDQNYQVKQRSSGNTSAGWTDGSLNSLNLEAFHGDLIGLRACWAGKNASTPMSLWYASDSTTFQEYLYQDDEWKWQRSWEGYNGAAGVGCFSWGAGPYKYVGFVNLDNQLEIWWQNSTSVEGPSGWNQTGVTLDDLHPASSMAFFVRTFVVQKLEQNRLWVYNMTWNGRDSKIEGEGIYMESEMLGGTHIAALPQDDTLLIYSQASGNDIEQSSSGLDDVGTPWDYRNIAI